MAVKPFLAQAIGVSNVRFYSPPVGRGNFAWVNIDDLFRAMPMPRPVRLAFKKDLRKDPTWNKAIETVQTEDGTVDIAPNWAVMGFIGAMMDVKRIDVSFQVAYTSAAVKASEELARLSGLDPREYFKDGLAHDFRESKGSATAA